MAKTNQLAEAEIDAMRICTTLILLFFVATYGRGQEIPIGVICPTTGESAYGGQSHNNGLQLAVDEFNEPQLQRGRFVVKLIYRDDRGRPDEAVAAFDDLVNKKNVVAIMGACNSANTVEIAKLAKKHQVVLITSVSAATVVTRKNNPFVFRAAITNSYQMGRTVEYLVQQKGLKRFAFFYENRGPDGKPDAYGRGLKEDFLDALSDLGIRKDNVLEIGYKRNQEDFSRELDRLNEGQYEAVGLFGLVDDAIKIAQGMRQKGINATIFGGTGIAAQKFAEQGGKSVEGAVVFSPFYALDSHWDVYQFTSKYREKFGTLPDTYSAQAYDAMQMVIKALGAIDLSAFTERIADIRGKLQGELSKVKHDGVTGYLAFDHNRDTNRKLQILVTHQGQLVPIRTQELITSRMNKTRVGILWVGLILAVVMTLAFLVYWSWLRRRSPETAGEYIRTNRLKALGMLMLLVVGTGVLYWQVPNFPEALATLFVSLFLYVIGERLGIRFRFTSGSITLEKGEKDTDVNVSVQQSSSRKEEG